MADISDIHPSLRASFVPLPPEPGATLTLEQLAAIAGGRNVKAVLRDILRLGLNAPNTSDNAERGS